MSSSAGSYSSGGSGERHHGMEPKGEFLLQLLQGGGAGGRREAAVTEEFTGAPEDASSASGWQHRDPAVAALGPSHSFHGGELLPQPNQHFMAPHGGVWTPQQQQQQQHHHFFPLRQQFPPYPPSAQLMEWRGENPMLEFSRRAEAPWLSRDRAWKSPLPPPLPPPPAAPQQFLGNGAELLQLLLGGKAPPNPGFPEELAGGIQVDGALPRVQVHGPIGPPKRPELQSEQAGGEELLGRFWATAGSSLANNGSPERNLEGQVRKLSLKEGLVGSPSRAYGFSPDQAKSNKVSKPPGFFGEREHNPIDPAFAASPLNCFSDLQGASKGPPLAWAADHSALDERGVQQNSSRFGRTREDHGYARTIRDDPPTSLASGGDETSSSSVRGAGGRGSGRRGGGGGGGGAGRGEVGRTGGRLSTGQWVAVHEKPREREEGLDERGVDATAKAKDESPNGSGGKSKEEMKRRRGQIQEWRMKQASPPHSKTTSEPPGLPSHRDGFSEGILPLASQVDRPGLPSNMVRHSMPGSATDESKQQLQHQMDEGVRPGGRERAGSHVLENGRLIWEDGAGEEDEDLVRELNFSGYAKLVDDAEHFSATPPNVQVNARRATRPTPEEMELEGRHENLRDSREVRRLQQRTNVPTSVSIKGDVQRLDLDTFYPQLLSIYKSLIPSQEEVQKRRKFLTHLDRLVTRDWGGAKLFLFGSCANDFGVCNSDIDVCLSVDDEQSSKAELVMKMAGILRTDDMQNVQALTHARVPIVKFTDPDTGINCDICVNNMLAVVNSKLLHDYSQVDPRLRQLAFLIKHWAKQRQVNETYRGTLSSYAYVLMCIHFLQQRRPAILPCLQKMQSTYEVTVGKIKCAYFDKVNQLKNFGTGNKESVAELLTYFFDYWASCHDYNRAVISVRTGGYLSKDEKDWTRRIGNERHLICIEDPFETTHDLGRVVDRHSIRVLRDEFKRASRILRHDPNPAVALFEPFVREKV